MIPVQQAYLDCIVYIYGTKVDAEAGALCGASGFLVAVPLETNSERNKFYIVTARHVLERMPNPVVRFNRREGVAIAEETNRTRWIDNPDNDDFSVLPLPIGIEDSEYRINAVFLAEFVDRGRNNAILPGDEVFMVGRFFSHEGKQKNAPAVRFGNISMMAIETMEGKYRNDQETYLVEQRSLPGYSGSPVFVLLDPSQPRPPYWIVPGNRIGKLNMERTGPWLLGIDWVHIHSYEPLLKGDTIAGAGKVGGQWVKAHTGMAGVIPAWRLSQMLLSDDFKAARKRDDDSVTLAKNNLGDLNCD